MKDEAGPSPNAEMAATLGLGEADEGLMTRKRLIVAAVLAAVLVLVFVFWPSQSASNFSFRTAPVTRADLTVTVTATGTLQPVNQVEVGAEISGQIEAVHVDFNDRISLGDTLATMDTDQLNAQVRQSRAQLASTQAKVEEAQANEVEARNNLQRAESLHAQGNVSEQSLDNAKAAHARSLAALASARAQVTVAEANVAADETNLAKAEITAPINGIVLERKVEPGQTVAASFQTPVLFTLAEDLTAMELVVDIDEADIGQVRAGQEGTFTVDAYPGRVFPASIKAVRFAPKTTDGVVTYEALLSVENDDLALRPGMTATASIVTATRQDATTVPYAALRFQPPAPPEEAESTGRRGPPGLMGMMMPRFSRDRTSQPRPIQPGEPGRVWVLENGQPRPIQVDIGLMDGQRAEVRGEGVADGLQVITGMSTAG